MAAINVTVQGVVCCWTPEAKEKGGGDWSTWGLSSLCPDPALWSGGGATQSPPEDMKSLFFFFFFFLSSELNAVSADSDSLWTLQGAANLPLMNEAVRGWQFRGHFGWCQTSSSSPSSSSSSSSLSSFDNSTTSNLLPPPAHAFEACRVGVWRWSVAVCTCLKSIRGMRKSKSTWIERNRTLTRCWDWFCLVACWPHLTSEVLYNLNILFLLSAGIWHSPSRHTLHPAYCNVKGSLRSFWPAVLAVLWWATDGSDKLLNVNVKDEGCAVALWRWNCIRRVCDRAPQRGTPNANTTKLHGALLT